MAYCTKPYKKEDSEIAFPCGKCLDCRKRRASSWGFRLSEQLKVSDTAWFLTLTYDSDHIHFAKKAKRPTLFKKDAQNFIRFLRRRQPNDDIKYYLAAEYGGTFHMRPHYHIIIFNMQLSSVLEYNEARRALLQPSIHLNGKYEFQSTLWTKGHITIGTVTNASSMYTLKYLSKPKRVPQYKNDDRTPEFSLISKGIGKSYLSPQIIAWHKNDPAERMYVNWQNYKIAMPRIYKEALYSQYERETIAEHIIQKQKDKRIAERKGQTLAQRIAYIRQHTVIIIEKDRKLNKKDNFYSNVL